MSIKGIIEFNEVGMCCERVRRESVICKQLEAAQVENGEGRNTDKDIAMREKGLLIFLNT